MLMLCKQGCVLSMESPGLLCIGVSSGALARVRPPPPRSPQTWGPVKISSYCLSLPISSSIRNGKAILPSARNMYRASLFKGMSRSERCASTGVGFGLDLCLRSHVEGGNSAEKAIFWCSVPSVWKWEV